MLYDWQNEPTLKMVMKKIGGAYEVLKYLGGGGSARVYKIRHKGLDQVWILKIMDFTYILNILEKKNVDNISREFEKTKQRFTTEAKIYRKFEHSNIVEIYGIGFVKHESMNIDIPYLIMEYVEGKTLKEVLGEKKQLDLKTIFKIAVDVLAALDSIHRKGIIHRDIKPSNIMIRNKNREVVLLDFGLAKDTIDTMKITDTHTAMGTLSYSSPEMFADSKTVTPRTDIYSFGIVLYEMITGELPFKGSSPEVLLGHLSPEKRFPKNPRLTRGLDRILKKAMAKDAADRFESAKDFSNALRELEKEIEEKPKRKYIYISIISIALALFIAAFFVLKSFIPQWQYNGFISSAKTFIEAKDWEKAGEALKKAKAIKDTPEIERLLSELAGKRTAALKKEFDGLIGFLKGESSNKDKLEECRKFLSKHQDFPGNGEKAAIFSEINNSISNLEAAVKIDEEYQNILNTASEYLKKENFLKALETAEKAKTNRGGNTSEITALYKEIEEKQIAAMRDNFESLKRFLASGAANEEKLRKCQAFLAKHQNTPGDNKTMFDETNRFISNLNADIKASEQYQRYIDTVTNLINSGDYEKAEIELNKARLIKNSDEVRRLFEDIEKKWLKAIKDKPTLSQYLAFQSNYPHSAYLQDLRDRLKLADKNLPLEKYWDKPIKKNEKGYYEITFGSEYNGHQMIYIPGQKFWIDKYEVSWAQFRKYLKDEKRSVPSKESNEYINHGDEFPAIVTYEEAQRYCQAYALRLPSKSEWEYAANGGKEIIYPWGNKSPDESDIYRANYDTLDGERDKDGHKVMAPVKNFETFSSPFGVVNMAGNVWEWIQGKVLKGGGYLSLEDDLKIENTRQAEPQDKEGFRCVKVEIR